MNTHPQLFLTAPSPCPYIKGQMERKIFTWLTSDNAKNINEELVKNGFRRSQNIAYRPACEKCSQCIPTKIIVNEFVPTKSMKRVIKKNTDLRQSKKNNVATEEQFKLFIKYNKTRHGNKGMSEMSFEGYQRMIEDSLVETNVFEFRKISKKYNRLVAAVLSDELNDGLSMVYSFFDPDEKNRSLGTFLILNHINETKKQGRQYCHLGYWVKNSSKMSYKARFKPQKRLVNGKWDVVE